MTAPAYIANQQHRDGNPHKCQWTIPEDEETAVFQRAHAEGWLLPSTGWGIHIRDGQAAYVGMAVDRQRELLLAKFVAGNAPVVWHGYPADHQMNPQDIPDELVLSKWLNSGVLSAPKLRKIGKAQRCRI